MQKKYKRALWGYNKQTVDNMFSDFKINVKSIENNYEKEFTRLQEENKKIRGKIEQAEQELQHYRSIRRKLEGKLYNKFIEACHKLYEIESTFDGIIEEKNQILKHQHHINYEIKSLAERLLKQIQQLAGGESYEE